jgi:diguanylate cyclase (GGDEF)-like protein
MNHVLVVEDSPIIIKILKKLISDIGGFKPFYATSLAEATAMIDQSSQKFFAAIVDLNLPDAPSGEVVEYVLANDIPTIVLTGSYDEKKRESFFSAGIVDYVVKESRFSYEYAIQLVHRLEKNQSINVLVVEDSLSSRNFIRKLLEKHLFNVYEAENGVEAVEMLTSNPDIHLMITDYNMPEMDGFELITHIRRKMDKSSLIIIGLSSEGDAHLSAKFIKNGANDFLKKPFIHEEFHCRINHNIEEMELLNQVKDIANKDYLTGLFNRRHFYTQSDKIIAQYQSSGTPISACLIDIDHFKRVNDTYGHDIGDLALLHVANILKEKFESFYPARFGGEEFAVLFPRLDAEKAAQLVDHVRQMLEGSPIEVGEEDVFLTFSAGIALFKNDMDETLKEADERLYRAKEAGRNIVIYDD